MNRYINSVEVDQDLCVGCGYCIEVCPQVFSATYDGKAIVLNIQGCKECDCVGIAKECPVKAIYVNGGSKGYEKV